MRRTLALLGALLLAGCVVPWATPEEAPAASRPAAPPEAEPAVVAAAAPGPAVPALPASLSFSGLWLWPVQDQAATLEAPGATRVAWFVGIDGIHPDVRFVRGRPYVTAAPGKAADHPVHVGPLEPGGAAALRLHEAGRHVFALAPATGPGEAAASALAPAPAPVAVTVLPEGPERASVFLVEEEGRPRLVPDRVQLRSGGRLTFVHEAREPLSLHRAAFQPWIGMGGATLDLTPVDEGLYTLVAEVADDAGRRGEAQGRFLVDYDRPPQRHDLGPARGSFLGPPAPEQPEALGFVAELPILALRLWGNATSRLGEDDAAVRVTLARDGAPLARLTLTPQGGHLALADLPPGRYEVLIEPAGGNLLAYDLEGRVEYLLPVPERLRAG